MDAERKRKITEENEGSAGLGTPSGESREGGAAIVCLIRTHSALPDLTLAPHLHLAICAPHSPVLAPLLGFLVRIVLAPRRVLSLFQGGSGVVKCCGARRKIFLSGPEL